MRYTFNATKQHEIISGYRLLFSFPFVSISLVWLIRNSTFQLSMFRICVLSSTRHFAQHKIKQFYGTQAVCRARVHTERDVQFQYLIDSECDCANYHYE